MLHIKNLRVAAEGKLILKGISLRIKPGEVHAVMGPNGSGKSTLANAVMGHPKYKIAGGDILMDKKSIAELTPDKRAQKGILLSFQHPVEIPGVTVFDFLRTAAPSIDKKNILEKLKELSLGPDFLDRCVNEGFSGGEKKKLEILQMILLKPRIAIFDEIDSGLDIDALKTAAKYINELSARKTGILLITHYQRILQYVKPDFIHIMINGEILQSGKAGLADRIEHKGYEQLKIYASPRQ